MKSLISGLFSCLGALVVICTCLLLMPSLAHAQAGTCTKTGSVCSQGPETRSINGYAVYRACWQYKDTYDCYDNSITDTCSPLRPIAGCFELSAVCAENNLQGSCIRWATTMRCDHLEPTPANVIALTPTFAITGEALVESAQCLTLKADPTCTKLSSTCSQGPATRNVNGLNVTRDCWQYTDSYACIGTAGAVNFCAPLQAANNGCTEITSAGFPKCATLAADGVSCLAYDRQFTCNAVPVVPLPTNITIINQVVNVVADVLVQSAVCQAKIADGTCRRSGSICIDGPSTKTINGVPTFKECWQFQDTYTCDVIGGTGTQNYCAPLEAK